MATKKKTKPKNVAKKKKAKATTKAPDLWQLIEDAWAKVAPKLAKKRAKATEDDLEALDEASEKMCDALLASFEKLDKAALLAVDRQLERALYKIDRREIQEVTDGSDDGFLYARGFIVAMGKTFYDAVDANPKKAICDAECEEMCYLPWHLYREKFGEPPSSPISRESVSNDEGWAD